MTEPLSLPVFAPLPLLAHGARPPYEDERRHLCGICFTKIGSYRVALLEATGELVHCICIADAG
jgi:hypothetical protein